MSYLMLNQYFQIASTICNSARGSNVFKDSRFPAQITNNYYFYAGILDKLSCIVRAITITSWVSARV